MTNNMIMVRFYMKKSMHDFLKQLCRDSNTDMSEMLRSVVSYFFMAYTLGQWNMPMKELRKDFLKFMNDINKYEKHRATNLYKPKR